MVDYKNHKRRKKSLKILKKYMHKIQVVYVIWNLLLLRSLPYKILLFHQKKIKKFIRDKNKENLSFFFSSGCNSSPNSKKKSLLEVILRFESTLGQRTRRIPSLLSHSLFLSYFLSQKISHGCLCCLYVHLLLLSPRPLLNRGRSRDRNHVKKCLKILVKLAFDSINSSWPSDLHQTNEISPKSDQTQSESQMLPGHLIMPKIVLEHPIMQKCAVDHDMDNAPLSGLHEACQWTMPSSEP